MFYDFRQNNSGGSFVYDEERGLSVSVIIEAESADDANDRAERIGLYFNGVDEGCDCECCDDRWSRAYKDDGDEVPSRYGTALPTERPKDEIEWVGKGNPTIFIHYLDGTLESLWPRVIWRGKGKGKGSAPSTIRFGVGA